VAADIVHPAAAPHSGTIGDVKRILVLSTTTGYQVRAFGDAAERLGVELVFATDRCRNLDDPWRDHAIPVRFHDEDRSLSLIAEAAGQRPVDGVIAVGDRPTVLAARAAEHLGLAGHPPEAVRAAANKRLSRERLARAGLPVPWFTSVALDADPLRVASAIRYPCVVKPLALAGSRGVMRADDPEGFVAAFQRLRAILGGKDVRVLRDPASREVVIEGFVAGREFALEGILEDGQLVTIAIFDKPDPLDGPYFEETIYVTPSSLDEPAQTSLRDTVAAAAEALGLRHGPVHAEARLNGAGVFVHEVAARPIGGLCARALRVDGPSGSGMPYEELLLRHALGEPVRPYRRESEASGVMMIPIPRRGYLKDVHGLDAAAAVPGIDDLRITAAPDQLLQPLPEGASYLGFLFAHAHEPAMVVAALKAAHGRLVFDISAAPPVIGY
jgi:biotin carboxylase